MGTPLFLNTSKHSYDQEPHRPNKLECTQSRHAPKHNRKIDLALFVWVCGRTNSFQSSCAQYHCAQTEITHEPENNNRRSEAFIVIFLLFGSGHLSLLRWSFGDDFPHLGFILGIQISIVRWDVDVYLATR